MSESLLTSKKHKNFKRKQQAKRQKQDRQSPNMYLPIDMLLKKSSSPHLDFNLELIGQEGKPSFWQAALTLDGVTYIAPGYSKKNAKQNVSAVCLNRKFRVDLLSLTFPGLELSQPEALSDTNSAVFITQDASVPGKIIVYHYKVLWFNYTR